MKAMVFVLLGLVSSQTFAAGSVCFNEAVELSRGEVKKLITEKFKRDPDTADTYANSVSYEGFDNGTLIYVVKGGYANFEPGQSTIVGKPIRYTSKVLLKGGAGSPSCGELQSVSLLMSEEYEISR